MGNKNARLSLSVYDNRGNVGSFLTHAVVDDTNTIAAASTALATLKTTFLNVSDAGIKDGTFTVINSAIAAAPGDDADLSAGAVFDFSLATGTSRYGQWVPSYGDGGFLPGGHIDIGATDPAAFVSGMVAAVLGGHFTDAQYNALSAGLDAFLSSRKRKRRVR